MINAEFPVEEDEGFNDLLRIWSSSIIKVPLLTVVLTGVAPVVSDSKS